MGLKKILLSKVEIFHLYIFGHKISRQMKDFLKNLSWSFFGGMIAGIVLFAVNILAGRWLGPNEYGKYSLIVAISFFLVAPMTLGLEVSASRFITIVQTQGIKNCIGKFILKRTILSTLVIGLMGIIFILAIRPKLGIGSSLFYTALFLSMVSAVRLVADGILRGQNLFRKQALLRLTEGLIIMVVFLILIILIKNKNYLIYIISVICGYLVFFFLFLKGFWRRDVGNFYQGKTIDFQEIIKYGYFASIGVLATFLFIGSDKILVNKFLDTSNLGIYSAYFTTVILPMVQIQVLFNNVFFPAISKSKNKVVQLKKINKIALISFPLLLPLIWIFIFVVIKLFGRQYPTDLSLICLFGIYALIYLYVNIRQWILASISTKSIFFSSIVALIAGIIQLILSFWILKTTQNLHYLLITIIFSYLVFIGLNSWFIKISLKKTDLEGME